jgi:Spy/CpxP family protein refolding chaperone
MISRKNASFVAIALVCLAAPASAVALCETPAAIQQARTGPPNSQKPPHDGQGTPSREGGRRKWWQNEKDRAELGLTPQQSAEIEQIFQTTIPTLRAMNEELQPLEAALTQTITAGTADPATVQRKAERLETMRAKLFTARTVMFYRMHQVLSAEQRAKLKAMSERESERRGSDKRDEPRKH